MVTMSRQLSELLGASEPAFSYMIRDLEAVSGLPSVDVRLSADIEYLAMSKIREIGLDGRDLTGEELYVSLQHLVKKHDDFLVKSLGGSDASDVQDLLPRIKKALESLPIARSCWALKHSTARRLLKHNPPKKVMKVLGYRSLDSMLKRENVDELYAALRFVESEQWMERFIKSYKQLGAGDFEKRDIKVYLMSAKKWSSAPEEFVVRRRRNFTYLKEMGVVAVLPMPVSRVKGLTITLLPLLIYAINEIRLYSAFFKLHQVRPDFGDILMKTLINDSAHHIGLAGHPVHWRHVSSYFSHKGVSEYSEIFEPHVQPEDLENRRAEEMLYKLEPALKFWEGMEAVGLLFGDRPVSFNLIDNAVSYCNNLPYGQHAVSRMRENLWTKLWVRYIEQEALEAQAVEQLGGQSAQAIDIEMFATGGLLV